MEDVQTLKTAIESERLFSLAAAQEHMRHHRWASAAESLLRLVEREVPEEFQLNICRNLAALQQFRPAVYQAILGAQEKERYIAGVSTCGHSTIFYQKDDGSQLPLSPGNQPIAGLTAVYAQIKSQYQSAAPAAVLGIGDGYLLKSFALHPPAQMFGAQHSIYLIEPDAQAVLAALTIHDYTGPAGPIQAERFRWFVGKDYTTAMRECLKGDLYNPAPRFEISQSPHSADISANLRRLLDEMFADYQQAQAAVREYYAGVTREQLAAIFSPSPPRQPRMLLITTRQSSVLQYSTRDAAEALRSIGWDARVFIEPALHQSVTGQKLMELLHEFKPDAILQIDHLRREWADVYPAELPFICWMQDHLNHLVNATAGASISPRDFLLCGLPRMYTDRFGYPSRQFLQMPKLTRVPVRPASWRADGCDLVYVSSASHIPRERARQICEEKKGSPAVFRLLALVCEKMISHYDAGGSLASIGSILKLVVNAEHETGLELANSETRQQVAEDLFDRLNNCLYRQQPLRWAQAIADEHGLSLSIYGPGWEKHRDFSRHARGPIAYGPALEALSRSSRINLVLEPTLNISHQRLLDALVAGGFCLIRHHEANLLFQDFLNFICEYAPASAQTVSQVRAAIAAPQRPELENYLAAFEGYAVIGDPVTHVRGLLESQILLNRPAALPHLSEVTFKDQAELEARVLAYLNNPEQHRRIADRQREDVEGRFSYTHGMGRMVQWIGKLLNEEGS